MNRKILFCLTILVLTYFKAEAQHCEEIINGPANIRDTVNGRILFSLSDSLLVDTDGDYDNNWFEVGLFINLNERQLKIGKILKGESLFSDTIKIGIALSDIIVGKDTWHLVADDSSTTDYITGYTFKSNLRQDSFIEYILMNLIKPDNLSTRTLNRIKPLIDKYKFDGGDWKSNYKYYSISDDGLFYNPSPPIRIGLIFKDEILIAIVHSRNILIDKTTDYKIEFSSRNCLIFNDFSDKMDLLNLIDPYTYPK
jgi:hypothetical protein